EAPCSRDQVTFARPKGDDFITPALLSDQWDLQVGGPVLLGIKGAAVDVARTPEQQIPSKIDEIVLHEIRPFLQTERDKRLSEDALGRVDRPRRVSCRSDLVEHIAKSRRKR